MQSLFMILINRYINHGWIFAGNYWQSLHKSGSALKQLRDNREEVGTLGLDGTSQIYIFGNLLITGGAQRKREL